ncbi:MAG: DUF308 domain-containing protein [Caldilineaceae bacterium]|nr:DUF308 domain-containing protein [Caldilineaceae bacterium]
MNNLTKDAMDKAKDLAPWRSSLPWWTVLIEGIVMAAVGILILISPRQTTINVALFLAMAIAVAGIIRLWGVFRNKVPDSVEKTMAVRATVGTFSGGIVIVLYLLDLLTVDAGLVIFGIGAVIYGLMGFGVGFGTLGQRRRQAFLEAFFFTLIGLLMVYVYVAGPDAVHQATAIVGWVALIAGLALVGMAFWRRSQEDRIEELSEKVEEASDRQQDDQMEDLSARIEEASGRQQDEDETEMGVPRPQDLS